MAVVGRWEFGAESGPSGEVAAPVFDGASSFAQVAIKPGMCGPTGAVTFSFRPAALPGEGGQAALLALTPGTGGPEFLVCLAAGGSVQISAGGSICSGGLNIATPLGFCAPGDNIELICSWDAGGGGHIEIINASELAAGGGLGQSVFGALIPPGFSLEGAEGGSMFFGAVSEHGAVTDFFHGWIGKASGCDAPLPPVHPAAMPDGIVDGTAGNDVIDADYLGDPDGDRIDAGDAIIPGEGPDDDIVYAGDGNDQVRSGAGDDTVFGGRGNDVLRGGEGDDVLSVGKGQDVAFGGEGDDTLIGGEGHDVLFGGDDRDTFIGAAAGDVVDGDEGGDDFDVLDLRGMGPFTIRYTGQDKESGFVDFRNTDGEVTGSLRFRDIERIVPCFTPGTRIATPLGARPVETLRVGDKVTTRDNGLQEIRWIGSRSLSWNALRASEHLNPVLIRKGSLGENLPDRDMQVSPNHRMLVANDRTSLYFEEHEVLATAKHLVDNRGIHPISALGVTYIHFMFDQHEVVLADGVWTESFQPGDYTLRGIGNAQRNEIFELFPELKTAAGLRNYGSARRSLKGYEAKLLASGE